MGRPLEKSDCDELGAYIHKRNIVCSHNLLEALFNAHAPMDCLPSIEDPPTAPPRNLEPDWWPTMWFGDLVSRRPFHADGLTIASVVQAVSCHYKVSKLDIVSSRRTRNIVRPRQVCYYLAKRLTTKSLPEIGRRFNKDHTSVLSGIRRIEKLRATDSKIEADVCAIAASLGGSLG